MQRSSKPKKNFAIYGHRNLSVTEHVKQILQTPLEISFLPISQFMHNEYLYEHPSKFNNYTSPKNFFRFLLKVLEQNKSYYW